MYIHLLYYAFRIYCFIFRPVRMGVRMMLIQNDQILLVRHTYIPGWFMPGGGVKRGETLERAARREALEETGAKTGEVRLLGAYTSFLDWKTDHNIVFLCEDFVITGRPDVEIAEARFFPLSNLPQHLAPGHARRIHEYQSGEKTPHFGEW